MLDDPQSKRRPTTPSTGRETGPLTATANLHGIAKHLAAAVADAARLLDRHAPGWARRINTATLDMGSLHADILGQLYGEYLTGLHRLGLPLCASGQRGFNLTPRQVRTGSPRLRPRFDELTAAWIREIQHRRSTPTAAPGSRA